MLYSRSVGKGGEILDASAIVPLLVAEPTTRPLQALAEQDPDMLVWCSQVECVSALTRIERAATLDAKAVSTSFERLKQLADNWHEVEPGGIVRESAVRFLRVHSLRAADALQFAAAFVAAERRPPSLQFVTLDERLADAARKEGFELVDTAAG
jgi:predicted nucleic acid-binding protein